MGLGTVTKRSNVINEVARVADEKASVHSVIRLFGCSDGQRQSQQRIAALHGNNVHDFAIFQLDSVLNFEK